MKDEKLSEFIEAAAGKFGIPGAAAGMLVDGREIYACHKCAGMFPSFDSRMSGSQPK